MNGEEERIETGESTARQSAKEAAKTAGKKAVQAGAKAIGKALAKGIAYIVGLIGWPVLIVILAFILLSLFFAAFYSAMPASGFLTGVEQSEKDALIQEYAMEQAEEWNIKETWLVDGEGSWYPGEGIYLGKLVDRWGRESNLKNEWGNLYAPVLYQASMINDDNKLEDEEWVRKKLREAGEGIRPFFYYKESTVEWCGEDGCEQEIVYLLVEAYTIRGHYRYSYDWVTETYSDGSSVTYEKSVRTERLSDGRDYLKGYLVPTYDMPDKTDEEKEQVDLAVTATFEMGEGFSACAENLAWLEGYGSLPVFVSGAAIPAEYRSYLEEASQLTEIPVWLLAGIIERESSWNPNCENEKTGCFGLTQLNPKYWPVWAKRYGFHAERDKWDPRVQIIVGAQVLKGYASGFNWSRLKPDQEPPRAVKAALARYGGYGNDVDKASSYIESLWVLAKGYSCPGSWPTPGYTTITSNFGMRRHPVLGTIKEHTGIDIGAPHGAQVVSVSGGIVWDVGHMHEAWGNVIYIRDNQYEYQYAHLSRIDVKKGDQVNSGMKIGLVGSTGKSTGPHLHFGIRPVGGNWVDPKPMLNSLKKGGPSS